jgi:hypothetical protein
MNEIVIHIHANTDAELREQIDAARARGKLVQLDIKRNVQRQYFLRRGSRLVGEGGSATVIVEVDGVAPPLSPRDRLYVDMVRGRALTSAHAEAVADVVHRLESSDNEQASAVMRQLAKQAGVL